MGYFAVSKAVAGWLGAGYGVRIPRWRGVGGWGFLVLERIPTPVPSGHPRQRGIGTGYKPAPAE